MLGRMPKLGALLAVIVLIAAIGGGASATPGGPDASTNASTGENTTVPHVNPAEIRQQGDTERVSSHLEGRLEDRLTESAVAISTGEYERGRDPLGGEYGDLLDQYSTVADDLDEEEVATQFNLTRSQQRSVIDSIEELEATRVEYEQAVEEGDEERRRELARELLEGAAELNQTATELNEQYAGLDNTTSADFAEAQAAVENAQIQINGAASLIAQREFTATQLSVETNRTTVSVSEPAAVTGRLTTTNGTPVVNAPVQIQLDADTVTTTTDQNGSFEAVYRPLLASTTDSNLSVTYTPNGSDLYLPTRQRVPLTVSGQANTAVTLTNTTTTAALSQPVRASGVVQVADGPAGQLPDIPLVLTDAADPPAGQFAGIPLVLIVDGQRLATTDTNSTGEFAIDGVLPADVPPGDATLTVAIDRRDAAIARSAANDSVTIVSTPTTLTLDATPTGNNSRNLTATGELRIEEGAPLAARDVTLAVDGTPIGTVRTDGTGQYRETVTLPTGVTAGDDVTVTAQFDPTGTSLAAATVTQQVTLPAPPATDGGSASSAAPDTTQRRTGVIGVSMFILLMLVIARRSIRRWTRRLGVRLGVIDTPATATGDDPSPPESESPSSSDVSSSEGEAATTRQSRSPVERAQAAIAAGSPDDAVRIAYAAMRAHLQPAGRDDKATHWEFYRRWQDTGPVERTHLRSVTEAYETATFAPEPVGSGTAAEAVTASDEIIDQDEHTDT